MPNTSSLSPRAERPASVASQSAIHAFSGLSLPRKLFVALLAVISVFVVLWLVLYVFSLLLWNPQGGAIRMMSSDSGATYMYRIGMGDQKNMMGVVSSPAYDTGEDIMMEHAIGVPAIAPTPMPPMEDESGAGDTEAVFSADRQIIEHGSLSLVVDDVGNTATEIRAIAKEKKGYVENAQIYQDANARTSAAITVRVPEESFDDTLVALKALAREVKSEQVSADDVTAQAIDLEARIQNERGSEAQYQKILESAKTTEEVLRVQRELNRVRGTIEQLEAAQNRLTREIRMATIFMELSAAGDTQVGAVTWKPLNDVKLGVRNLLLHLFGFASMVIALVFLLPILVLWLAIVALIVYGAYRLGRVVQRKLFEARK